MTAKKKPTATKKKLPSFSELVEILKGMEEEAEQACGQMDEALEKASRLRTLQEDKTAYLSDVSTILRDLSDVDKALEELKKA